MLAAPPPPTHPSSRDEIAIMAISGDLERNAGHAAWAGENHRVHDVHTLYRGILYWGRAHETDGWFRCSTSRARLSDSRDCFWLLVPHSSMAASTVTDPSSQGATTRHAARRRGSDTRHDDASLLGSHRLLDSWWMGSRRRCRRVCGGGRAVRHLATDAEDADCGASSGDRACRSSRQAWAKCTGSDGDARGGEWQHQTAALSCTCRTWHWCSKRFASGNGAKRRTSR